MQEAIQLISINSNSNFELTNQGYKLLSSLSDHTLSILSICGPQRSGKSYLCNLFSETEAFILGSTTNPETKGIWAFARQVADKHSILVLDCEGLNSCSRNQKMDAILFSLSILLSSLFVYNQLGHIDESSIESLALVVRANQGLLNQGLYGNLLWVCRDYSLNQQDQYIEFCLKDTGDQSKDKGRKAIRNFFREREAICLVRPLADEQQLANIQLQDWNTFSENFKIGIGKLKTLIQRKLRPKVINNIVLNGNMYQNLIQSYLSAFNQNKIPEILTSLENVKSQQAHKNKGDILLAYEKEIKETFENKIKLPIDQGILIQNLQQIQNKTLSLLDKKINMLISYEKMSQIKEEMEWTFQRTLNDMTNKNRQLSKQFCKQSIDAFIEQNQITQINSLQEINNQSLANFQENFKEFAQQFAKECQGPQSFQVFCDRIIPYLFDQFHNLKNSTQNTLMEEINLQKLNQIESNRRYDSLKEQLESLSSYIVELQTTLEKKENFMIAIQKEKETLSTKLSIQSDNYQSLEKKFDIQKKDKKEFKQLAEDLKKANQKLQIQNQNLQNQLNKTKDSLNIQNTTSQLQYQLDQDVNLNQIYQQLKLSLDSLDDNHIKILNQNNDSFLEKMKKIYEEKNKEIQGINDSHAEKIKRIEKENEDNLQRILSHSQSIQKNNEYIKSQLIEFKKNTDIISSKREIEKLNDEKKNLSDILQQKSKNLLIFNEQIEYQDKEIQKLKNKLMDMQINFSKTESQKNILRSNCDEFPCILQEFYRYMKNQENRLKDSLFMLDEQTQQNLVTFFQELGIKIKL